MLFSIFFFGIGVAIGSFLNAFAWRFLRQERISEGRSMCVHCHHVLSARDLVPVISYALLKGRCRYCRKPIPWYYPLVELVTGILFLFLTVHYGPSLVLLPVLALLVVLEMLFLLDMRYSILPDSITIPGMVVACVVGFLLGLHWENIILGGILGAGFFGLQYVVSQGKWIGEGDIRLGALMGLVLGWQVLLVALFLSYILGAFVGVLLILRRVRGWGSHIPFGVFLTVSTIIALLWGQQLVETYKAIIFLP